ncbi:hypothetical protein [Clostridium cochlearium]|uniref:hypothetical protein n=1 Tax=Clostridium cochlearium TaxID=1494 RepID=UPI000BBC322F|nr:hypothetical protein [Clostridium cochlearium]
MNLPDKSFFTVSFEQMSHDFAMLKLRSKLDNSKLETYGDLMAVYIEELDTMKCYLKSLYGEDIFTK